MPRDGMVPKARPAAALDPLNAGTKQTLLTLMNSYSKRSRQKRYHQRIEHGWTGLRIVSEGDSRFQFPMMVDDIIDYLSERYAIYSLGEGGDTSATICGEREQEIIPAVQQFDPHCFLLSRGGNDMVKNGGLANLVHEHMPGAEPEAHLHPNLDDLIAGLQKRFRLLFDATSTRSAPACRSSSTAMTGQSPATTSGSASPYPATASSTPSSSAA